MCFTTFLCAIANGYDGSLMTGLIAVSNMKSDDQLAREERPSSLEFKQIRPTNEN